MLNDLQMMLHKAIARHEAPRPHTTLHASSLTDTRTKYCPRYYRLLDKTGDGGQVEFIHTSLAVTFDYGHHLQWMVNNRWLRDRHYGKWKCTTCAKTHVGFAPKNPCTVGWDCPYEYVETRALSQECGASCGLDGLIFEGKDEPLRLIEVKTEQKDEFKELSAPRSEHRQRTALYMRIIDDDPKLKGKIATDWAWLLYVCKGYGVRDGSLKSKFRANGITDFAATPFKQFKIQRNDEITEAAWQKALTLKQARDLDTMCEGICTSPTSSPAKNCSMKTFCFSEKFK